MNIWAVVPVKVLEQSKSRLSRLLSPTERASLTHTLLQQTLACLATVATITQTIVVSPDEKVLTTAKKVDCFPLREALPFTLNSAFSHGINVAAKHGATGVLLLPTDLPYMKAKDIRHMLLPPPTPNGINICSDYTALGTNALYLTPPYTFTPMYGHGSFQKHLQEAQKGKRAINIIEPAGLKLDLDTEADWHWYSARTINPT